MPAELTVTRPEAAASVTTIRKAAALIAAQREAIVQLMRDVMKEDVDYGTIPGTPKPTLYKPGSEKLLSMFRMSGKPIVEDLSTPDMIRYQVHFVITDEHGNFLGEGIGEASSAESKYQWRRIVCQEEWDATPGDRRRLKWKRGKDGAYSEQQVRADMEDIANTVLKMAKKRAQIDAVLTVTAASDVFSQDIEDLKEMGIDPAPEQGVVDAQGAAPATLQKKPQTAAESAPAPASSAQAAPSGSLFDGGQKPAAAQKPLAVSQPAAPRGKTVSEPQGRRFYAIAREHGWSNDDINGYLQREFGVRRSDEIPADRYEKAIAWAEGNE